MGLCMVSMCVGLPVKTKVHGTSAWDLKHLKAKDDVVSSDIAGDSSDVDGL